MTQRSDEVWLDSLCERQRLDVLGDLIGAVAHQMNNALSVVTGYEELLLESLDDDPLPAREDLRKKARTVHTWTATALSAARRLHDLSTHLRQDQGPAEVNALVSEAVELARFRCEREEILLLADFRQEVGDVSLSPRDLLHCLINLVQNAREALLRAGEGGTISVTTEMVEGHVCITVEDDGPGVADPEAAFAIGESSKEEPHAGLGLPVARRLVERVGGRVVAEPGDGGRFVLRLPPV